MKALKEKPVESPERLADFCRTVEEVGCVKLEVRHVVSGQEGMAPVCTFELTDAGEAEGGAHFNAEDIFSRMQGDAEGVGGVQRYAVLAFREAQRAPRDRLLLAVDGGSADAGEAGIAPANVQQAALALVAQSHKHIENMAKNFMGAIHGMTLTFVQQNKLLAERLEKSDEERTELWAMIKEFQVHDREKMQLEADIAQKDKQGDVLRDGLKLLLPAIISKVLPGAQVKDEAMIRIIESLSDEQRAIIFGSLTSDQQVAFGMLIDEHIKKKGTNNGAGPSS